MPQECLLKKCILQSVETGVHFMTQSTNSPSISSTNNNTGIKIPKGSCVSDNGSKSYVFIESLCRTYYITLITICAVNLNASVIKGRK